MAYIKAISYFLPEKIISNNYLAKEFPEWSVEKISNKIGINNRHVVRKNETVIDLAIKAANKLFEEHLDIKKERIDFIILCTQSPDYLLPSSACIIQEKLGLSTKCGAFDFNLGCSGYIYGLAIAKGLIAGGMATNILLVTAETYSKHIHPRDKGNRTIFGDAATATIVSTDGWGNILDFSLGTDGRGAENLILRTGGMKNKTKANDLTFDENGNPISSDHLYMNGSSIFSFTQKNVPKIVKDNLFKNKMFMEDLNLVIFHQANGYMLEFLRNKIKIPKEKFFINMSEIGNTVSNSIPIALADAISQGLVPLGNIENSKKFNILLCGFGVGYSWGACVIQL